MVINTRRVLIFHEEGQVYAKGHRASARINFSLQTYHQQTAEMGIVEGVRSIKHTLQLIASARYRIVQVDFFVTERFHNSQERPRETHRFKLAACAEECPPRRLSIPESG
jgi:hypothetical protein